MKAVFCVLACLAATCSAEPNRPVSKVVSLLKDMQSQLEKEAEEDQDIYDKMSCWCETNDKEKTKAIADAEARITDLTTKVEESSSTSARLAAEIKNHKTEVAKNQEALDQATALRKKELAQFTAEEKELLQSVQALKAALTVLSKHHQAMIQVPRSHLLGVAATLQHELDTHGHLLRGVLTPSERRAALAFAQKADFADVKGPAFRQAYAPQSGQIFGILKQMKQTFENNLSESQKNELANQKAYAELKQAKEQEISAGQAQIDSKTEELANADSNNAAAKQDIEDTKASLSADDQFLSMLKEKCALTDKEWEERQKTRQEEIEAVSQALAILASDDSHDLFKKTFNAGFLQLENSVVSERRSEVVALLASVAQRVQNPRLAAIAESARLDAFSKVKETIDKMITQLLKEKADEIKHRDFCTGALNENEMETEAKTREKNDLDAKAAALKSDIEALTVAINDLNEQIATARTEMKRAGETREKQNKEFQTIIADQRQTQALLKNAKEVLAKVYQKSFVQQGPAPPAGFKSYKKNEGGNAVLSLLTNILNDAAEMEKETVHGEENAQTAYEEFVKATNTEINAKNEDIVNKQSARADALENQVVTKEGIDAAKIYLEQQSNERDQLKNSCDFVMKNFEIRQTARDEEVEALRQAKAILSGAKFQDALNKA